MPEIFPKPSQEDPMKGREGEREGAKGERKRKEKRKKKDCQ